MVEAFNYFKIDFYSKKSSVFAELIETYTFVYKCKIEKNQPEDIMEYLTYEEEIPEGNPTMPNYPFLPLPGSTFQFYKWSSPVRAYYSITAPQEGNGGFPLEERVLRCYKNQTTRANDGFTYLAITKEEELEILKIISTHEVQTSSMAEDMLERFIIKLVEETNRFAVDKYVRWKIPLYLIKVNPETPELPPTKDSRQFVIVLSPQPFVKYEKFEKP